MGKKRDVLRDLRGFGTVEKWVLTDPKLSISAKGLYALLCSFAGDKDNAFPGTDLLRYQLNISKDTLHKYIKELREKAIIRVEQEREAGRFSRNIYTLLPYGSTVSEKVGHGKSGDDKTGGDNLDTNSNSLKKNSSKSNRVNTPLPPEGESAKPKKPKAKRARKDFDAEAELLARGVEKQVAQDYLQVRKAKRAPLTLTAINRLQTEAEKAGVSVNEAVAIAVANGWQGFRAEYVKGRSPMRQQSDGLEQMNYGSAVIPKDMLKKLGGKS